MVPCNFSLDFLLANQFFFFYERLFLEQETKSKLSWSSHFKVSGCRKSLIPWELSCISHYKFIKSLHFQGSSLLNSATLSSPLSSPASSTVSPSSPRSAEKLLITAGKSDTFLGFYSFTVILSAVFLLRDIIMNINIHIVINIIIIIYTYKVVISVCMFVYLFLYPIITQEPLDGFASNFYRGTRES